MYVLIIRCYGLKYYVLIRFELKVESSPERTLMTAHTVYREL